MHVRFFFFSSMHVGHRRWSPWFSTGHTITTFLLCQTLPLGITYMHEYYTFFFITSCFHPLTVPQWMLLLTHFATLTLHCHISGHVHAHFALYQYVLMYAICSVWYIWMLSIIIWHAHPHLAIYHLISMYVTYSIQYIQIMFVMTLEEYVVHLPPHSLWCGTPPQWTCLRDDLSHVCSHMEGVVLQCDEAHLHLLGWQGMP